MAKADEYYFKEGCYIEEWHNSEQDPEMSVAKVRVEIGQTTRLHTLAATEERYVMLEGQAIVTVGEKSWPISKGEVVVIPADAPQKIENCGAKDIVFLAICTPRFDERNYRDIETSNSDE